MKKFDENYILLKDMVEDDYYPKFLVDKVKDCITPVIGLLERGETDKEAVQAKLDERTLSIEDIQEEFDGKAHERATGARDSIGVTVGYILDWFGIDIDVEDAIGERDW